MAMLSVVMIIKNEAHHLAACLQSVAFADEIIVLDSGSTDDSLAIARQYGAKVFQNHDWLGFGKQRQRAQSFAKGDWILMIDADERVSPDLAQAIQSVIHNNTHDVQQTVYAVQRHNYCFGQRLHSAKWAHDKVMRLYPRNLSYSDDQVHESLQVPERAQVVVLDGALLHFTYRDLQHYLLKSAHYSHAWAQQNLKRGKRVTLLQGVAHAVISFVRGYVVRGGFLDGRLGFLLAALAAHSTFYKYAALWVLQLQQGSR